jgi:hypothetical protein
MLIASISEPSLVRSDYPMIRTDHPEVIAVAQVHATLALAAATAGGASGWRDVHDDPGPGGPLLGSPPKPPGLVPDRNNP